MADPTVGLQLNSFFFTCLVDAPGGSLDLRLRHRVHTRQMGGSEVKMIPNASDGWRPLSVASTCWRLGATLIARVIGDSAQYRAPAAVQGCLPKRGVHNVHQRVAHMRQQNSRAMVVNDVSKAFDHVHVGQALALLWHVGIGEELLWRQAQFMLTQ